MRDERLSPHPVLRWGRIAVAAVAAVALAACGTPAPDDQDGLRQIARRFLAPGADPTAIVLDLRPDDADYAEVFRLDRLADARLHYAGYWHHPAVLGPPPDQTEFTIGSVTTEELLAGTGASAEFAGGYRTAAPALAPGLRIHQIAFRAPGRGFGVVVDGFVLVNGRWRIVPAPWAVLAVHEPGHQH